MSGDPLLIGLVSISDRASAGVYEDKGIPALKEWFGAALTSPWTIDGTIINLYDHIGVQADTETWPIEAEWDVNGARCLSHQRIQDMPEVPQCAFELTPASCGNPPHWNDTLLVSEAL